MPKNQTESNSQLSAAAKSNVTSVASFPISSTPIALKNESMIFDDSAQRRSSRSIKRKKFDDELIDSISTYQKHQAKPTTKPLETSETFASSSNELTLPDSIITVESKPIIGTTSVKNDVIQPSIKKINKTVPIAASVSHKKKTTKKQTYFKQPNCIKENNFWKPTDDLILIINVEQTNDLRKVFNGVKFSSNFTYEEVESRWRSLLYDFNVKSLALASIRQLHSDIVVSIQSNALLSDAEENLLKKINSFKEPELEELQKLLDENSEIFLSSRTPKILLRHWRLLRHYLLLNDLSLQPLPRHESVVCFSEIEKIVKQEVEKEIKKNADSISDSSYDLIDQEIVNSFRKNMLEIRMLENEIPKYQVLLDSITGIAPSDFDKQTYAVLRGRLVRYLMRSTEITIGRCTKDFSVDVNLFLEGPSSKISRLQAVINLQPTGEFIIFNTGKRAIFIDSQPLLTNKSTQIKHNSLIEFSTLKFLFLINQDLILDMRNEILQSCNLQVK